MKTKKYFLAYKCVPLLGKSTPYHLHTYLVYASSLLKARQGEKRKWTLMNGIFSQEAIIGQNNYRGKRTTTSTVFIAKPV